MNEFDKLLETIRKVLGDQIKDARVSHPARGTVRPASFPRTTV